VVTFFGQKTAQSDYDSGVILN